MKKQGLYFRNQSILSVFLVTAFAWSLFSVDWGSDLLHSGGTATILHILGAIFQPDFSPEILKLALLSSWRTLAYATAGMTLAVFLAFFLGIPASGILAARPLLGRWSTMGMFRGLLGFMRAIHELVWAWLFVAAIGLTPFAAIFALAIPYGGILGRILADILNDVPQEPIKALKVCGAGRWQLLFYGYLPMALADMISYTMYRFECAVRSAAIMSFVGLGGLGYQIQISLDDLQYNEVWTFIFFLVTLVVLVDIWSNQLRKKLVA